MPHCVSMFLARGCSSLNSFHRNKVARFCMILKEWKKFDKHVCYLNKKLMLAPCLLKGAILDFIYY